MNPRLLHRLRRRLRRRHKIMMPGQSHPYAAHAGRCDEEEPPPPKKMKRLVFLMLFVIVLGIFTAGLIGCATTSEKITSPDGTITERQRKEADPAAKAALFFAGDVARAYSPRRLPDRHSGK